MVNTPSIRFCCCDFGSAATARSSRGIASAYFPESKAFTPLRYGSAHRLFCAYARVSQSASSVTAATTTLERLTSVTPLRLEAYRGRDDEFSPKHIGDVRLEFRAYHDPNADRSLHLRPARHDVERVPRSIEAQRRCVKGRERRRIAEIP